MSDRERTDTGQFVQTTTLEDVLDVFNHTRGPVITSGDVAGQFDCTTESARQKLTRLYDQGRVDRRKTGRVVVYWRTGDGDDGSPKPAKKYDGVNTKAVDLVRNANGRVGRSAILSHVDDDLEIAPDSWWKRHGRDALEDAGADYVHNKGWGFDP